MPKIEVKGLDKLQKALKEKVTLDDVKQVVSKNGQALQRNMKREADFTQGYQTGQTKRSISLDMQDSGFTAEVGPETKYSPYLEYGTRFMNAQNFVRPSYEEQAQKFNSDMQKLVR